MQCQMGFNCADMGAWNGRCVNRTTCESLAVAGMGVDYEEEIETDDLSHSNANLTYACYSIEGKWGQPSRIDPVTGRFWRVRSDRDLAEGYAQAVPIDLPVEVKPMCMTVIKNRESCTEDGSVVGHFAVAEYNRAFWLELGQSPITLIEWMDVNDPNSIRMIRTEDGEYFHCDIDRHGNLLVENDQEDSVQNDYWMAPGSEMPDFYGDRVRAVDLPLSDDLKRLVRSAIFVDAMLYCNICNATTYEGRHGASECGHIRYIEHLNNWGGCGYGEEDLSDSYQKAFQELAQMLIDEPFCPDETVDHLIQLLQDRKVKAIWRLTDHYNSYENIEPALQYLDSLNKAVPGSYFEQAIAWIKRNE